MGAGTVRGGPPRKRILTPVNDCSLPGPDTAGVDHSFLRIKPSVFSLLGE
jgi:hypothetical protein